MIGLVVYNSGIYTQEEDYYGDAAIAVDPLVGDYLGDDILCWKSYIYGDNRS